MLLKLRKIFLWSVALFFGLIAGFFIYAHLFFRLSPPEVTEDFSQEEVWQDSLQTKRIKNNWLKQNEWGLWEMYVEGEAYERGVYNGKLTKELNQLQEDYFVAQIREMIPSDTYLKFLRYFIGFFNRNIDQYIQPEFKQEIYGISQTNSEAYNFIGSPYERLMNYHAAHDIGHALVNMSLVACTSFAVQGEKAQGGELLVGRNFDFYVGDDFAKNKIIAFVQPDQGHAFASVTWAGFIGVVSGMNEKGLTVTMNAGDSEMPGGSATPISIVAREILQYASNIEEAEAIARKRETFVSEALMIASAEDDDVAIIEKTPHSVFVRRMKQEPQITCTNHFLSGKHVHGENATNYRYQRLNELIALSDSLNHQQVAAILRDRKGLAEAPIGMGNEKAINQLLAHHAVIFKPEARQMWVSTAPFQLGEFICYDLDEIFNEKKAGNVPLAIDALRIPADPFLQTQAFKDFLFFKENKKRLKKWEKGSPLLEDTFIVQFRNSNPNYYETHHILGNYFVKSQQVDRAMQAYEQALALEIANLNERDLISEKLQELRSE